MKRNSLILLFLVSIILLQGLVLADSGNSALSSLQLQNAAKIAECKTTMINDVIKSLGSMTSSSTLAGYSSQLSKDLSQLQAYAGAGSKDSFKNYLKNNYDSDYKTAKEAIQTLRKNPGKNISAADRASLKSSYGLALQTFQGCQKDSLKSYSDGRVTSFNSQLDAYQKKADYLKSKGADTSSLDKIVQDAKDQIITPLQTDLGAATTREEIELALKSYCLFNGCQNGTNFHLAAKFSIAELNIVVTRISNTTWANNFTTQLSQVNSDISAANDALTSVGTDKYLDDQEQAVWNNIKSARDLLKQIKPAKNGGTNQ
jgi:hypothetical protein